MTMGNDEKLQAFVAAKLRGEHPTAPKIDDPGRPDAKLRAWAHDAFSAIEVPIPNLQGDPGALDPATPREVRAAIESWHGDRERMMRESTAEALRAIGWKSGADLRREDEEAARAAQAAELEEEDEDDADEDSASEAELAAWNAMSEAERADALEGGPSLAEWRAAVSAIEEGEET